ncbi:hypothetical protein JR316_0002623 [Psilocybe cubensis]|uniref:Uncharacterized protein n=2 Tax=Psilocybe cubensis TaxID=181762 RepID=A0A8H7Y627_PSICU|nr:hypothetical protein JR316_0002623 [Psilocybe cubensis]KAH9485710.1 hypothetical protein JR316_0002623 [Psilocybe cubensis]
MAPTRTYPLDTQRYDPDYHSSKKDDMVVKGVQEAHAAIVNGEVVSEGCPIPSVDSNSVAHIDGSQVICEKIQEKGGKMDSIRHIGARKLLRSLDCRRRTAATLFDDTNSDVVKVPKSLASVSTHANVDTLTESSVHNSCGPEYSAYVTSNQVRLTEEWQYDATDIRTRSVIRTRKRSLHAAKNSKRGRISRMRSLDCMHNNSAFETSVDIFQNQTFGIHPDLVINVGENQSKKEDLIARLPKEECETKRVSFIEVGRQ